MLVSMHVYACSPSVDTHTCAHFLPAAFPTPLSVADGRYREVVPAARMACPVEVLTYTEVLALYPGKDEREAPDMYEKEFAHKKELDSGGDQEGGCVCGGGGRRRGKGGSMVDGVGRT